MTSSALRACRAGAAVLAAGALSLGAVHPVFAHDVHTFGPFTVALGWLHEPAYVGEGNAVQVLVKQGDTAFTNITDKDLTVTVSLGGQSMSPMPMLPTADPDTGLGIPGEYEASFYPTAPGNYSFLLKGAINGTPVNETVTASDKTFATVGSPSDVEFPNKLPSTTDLSTKVDRVAARVSTLEGRSIPPNAMPLAIAALVVAVVLGGGGILMARGAGRRSSEI